MDTYNDGIINLLRFFQVLASSWAIATSTGLEVI